MSRIRIPRLLAVALGVMLFVSCADPTLICACSELGPHVLLHGRVYDPAGAPVPNAFVYMEVGPPGCQAPADTHEQQAGASGFYELYVFKVGEDAQQCVRVVALPPAGSTLRGSDTLQLTVPTPRAYAADSVRRDLVLRAP